MPKNQSTAAKKARAIQRTTGGKHTAFLADQVCGRYLDVWGVGAEGPLAPIYSEDTCNRAPHSSAEPCSADRDFDVEAWKREVAENVAEQQAWIAKLNNQEKADLDRQAFEDDYDNGRTASEAWEDARSYKWED